MIPSDHSTICKINRFNQHFLKILVNNLESLEGATDPILSPSHRVVEHQLLIPGFLPELLGTSGGQENLRFLEKVAGSGN